MTVWELVIIIVVSSICVFSGIGYAYSCILNAAERYQVRAEKRRNEEAKKWVKAVEELVTKIVNSLKEADKQKAENHKKMMEDLFKQEVGTKEE